MSDGVLIALLTVGGTTLLAVSAALGHWLGSRATRAAATATAEATVKVSEDTAQDKLIDQLQEELSRYRQQTDNRLDKLEAENRGYRVFIGVQRDYMAEHGVPLPAWPDGLPR